MQTISPVILILPLPVILDEFKSRFPPNDGSSSSDSTDMPVVSAPTVQCTPSYCKILPGIAFSMITSDRSSREATPPTVSPVQCAPFHFSTSPAFNAPITTSDRSPNTDAPPPPLPTVSIATPPTVAPSPTYSFLVSVV